MSCLLEQTDSLIRSGVAHTTQPGTPAWGLSPACQPAAIPTGTSRLAYFVLTCSRLSGAVLNITSKIQFLESRIWTLVLENKVRVLENPIWSVGKFVVCVSVFPAFVLCRWRKEEFYIDTTLHYSLHSSDYPLYCHSLRSLDNPWQVNLAAPQKLPNITIPQAPSEAGPSGWWSCPPWDVSLRLLFRSTENWPF